MHAIHAKARKSYHMQIQMINKENTFFTHHPICHPLFYTDENSVRDNSMSIHLVFLETTADIHDIVAAIHRCRG